MLVYDFTYVMMLKQQKKGWNCPHCDSKYLRLGDNCGSETERKWYICCADETQNHNVFLVEFPRMICTRLSDGGIVFQHEVSNT